MTRAAAAHQSHGTKQGASLHGSLVLYHTTRKRKPTSCVRSDATSSPCRQISAILSPVNALVPTSGSAYCGISLAVARRDSPIRYDRDPLRTKTAWSCISSVPQTLLSNKQ